MSRNEDYTTRHLVDYLYNPNYYKLISIDLSRQTSTSITQESNFPWKLEDDDSATMFFITEKKRKTILNFSLDTLTLTE